MARDRSIKLIIQAQVDGAKRALRETADAAKKVGDEAEGASKRADTAAGRMVQSARNNQQAWNTAGTALAAFGTASALAMGGSAKAAIDWESAWAGVTKTVDASAEDLGALNEGLREMARTLPASHSEIAAVAEAAGQLGIETPNILDFTRTMIDLGEATNLSAEQAATAIARFANIMGTSQTEFSNIGSSVVELGNNFATTEAEIVEMGLRLAGAGRQAGLTEGEVLGLATALSSVGIEAQAGGTAFSRVLIEMGVAVDTQGDKLATFAEVAGMTAEQFSTAWEQDAGSAIAAFVSGLGEMEASGQSIQPVLEELGMTDIRVGDALRRASGAADLFTGAMDMGNAAFAENTALAEEAAQRYQTVESRLAMAKNSIVDAAISLGEVFLPAIGSAADATADFAGWLAGLPDPVQGLAAGLGSVAAAAGLTGGAFFLMAPRLIESYDAFRDLAGISPRLSSALGRVGGVVARGGILVAGLAAIGTVVGQIAESTEKGVAGVNEFEAALLDLSLAADPANLDALFSQMDAGPLADHFGIDSLSDALDRLLDPTRGQELEAWSRGLFGVTDSGDRAAAAMAQLDAVLAGMTTSQEGAELAGRMLQDALVGTQWSVEDVMTILPGYRDALAGLDNEQRVAGDAAVGMGDDFDQAAADLEAAEAAAEAAQAAYDGLRSSIEMLGSTLLGARGSARGYEEALDAAAAAVKEHGETLDISTEAGRANQAALDALAGSTMDYATAAMDAGAVSGEVAAIVARGRDDFIATAEAMGLGSAEAEALADRLGLIPENVQLMFEASGLDGIVVDIDGTVDYAASVEALIQMGVEPSHATKLVEDWIAEQGDKTATSNFSVDPEHAEAEANAWIAEQAEKTATALLDANSDPATAEADEWVDYAKSQRPQPYIDADSTPADAEAVSWLNFTRGLTPVAGIDAADRGAYAVAQRIVNSIGNMWAFINVGTRYAGGLNMGGADPTRVSARAAGGVVSGYAPHVAGPAYGITDLYRMGIDGRLTHYAESGRGLTREAYISDHPAYATDNVRYLREAAGWFGMDVVKAYAAGGVAGQPSYASPAPAIDYDRLAQGIAGALMPALDAVASQPIHVDVDGRNIALAARRGEASFGPAATWSRSSR